jgi:hypothetical protein
MPDDDGLWTSEYWRDRAEEARARAGEMRDPEAKTTMLRIAEMYDSLAERVARRASQPPSN